MSEGPENANRGRAVIAWVAAPLVGIAFFPTILLVVIGMAPSIVAFIIDKRPRKVTARSIGYLNFAGALPYALQLWTGQNTISGVMELVLEPAALMIMYGAAAVGWTLNFIMAPIMSAYLAVQHESKARSIASRQEKLVKEWGSDVRGQAAVPAAPQQPVEQAMAEENIAFMGEPDTAEDPAEEEEVT